MSGRVGTLPPPGRLPGADRRVAPVGRAGVPPGPGALERELAGIRRVVMVMGSEVDRAITHAVCGLVDRDLDVCAGVAAVSARLHSLQGELRRRCVTTGLERDPAAPGMREAVALLHVAAGLQRIGDHCAAIARVGRELADLPEPGADPGLATIADHCAQRAREVLLAVGAGDPQRTLTRRRGDDRLERLRTALVAQLAERAGAEPASAAHATRALSVARLLERITDRVEAIAEDLLLVDAGAVELPGLHAAVVSGR